jgi:hypothetical protein
MRTRVLFAVSPPGATAGEVDEAVGAAAVGCEVLGTLGSGLLTLILILICGFAAVASEVDTGGAAGAGRFFLFVGAAAASTSEWAAFCFFFVV